MKQAILLICNLLLFDLAGQNFHWAKQIGGKGNGYPEKTVMDRAGFIYNMGWYSDSVDFDPGPGVKILHTYSQTGAIFICKHDTTGKLIWAGSIESGHNISWPGLTTDKNNNVYLCGTYSGAMDADPGPMIYGLQSVGFGANAFLIKLGPSGNLIWVKNLGIAGGQCNAREITTDPSGNLFVAGGFQHYAGVPMDFDPGTGTHTVTCLKDAQSYILALDSSGLFKWVSAFTTVTHRDNSPGAITADGHGDVIVTGHFDGVTDFDPGPSTYDITPFGEQSFVVKLDQSGLLQWAGTCDGGTHFSSVVTDSSGTDIFLTGLFTGSGDIDPGQTVFNVMSPGMSCAFVEKLDGSGKFKWARTFGGIGQIATYAISLDKQSNSYVTGYFERWVDLDPGAGIAFFSTSTDAGFALKLDSLGKYLWAKCFLSQDSVSSACGVGIVNDGSGNVYVSGAFNGTIDIDPGYPILNYVSVHYFDMFISRLSACNLKTESPKSPTICTGEN